MKYGVLMRFSISKPQVKVDLLTHTERLALLYLCSTESKKDTATGISMRTGIPEKKIRVSMLCLEDAGLVRQYGQMFAPEQGALDIISISEMSLLRSIDEQKDPNNDARQPPKTSEILYSRLKRLSDSIVHSIAEFGGPEALAESRSQLSRAEKAAAAAVSKLDKVESIKNMSRKQLKRAYSAIMRDAAQGYTKDALFLEGMRGRLISAINIVNSMALECIVSQDAITTSIERSDLKSLSDAVLELKALVKKTGLGNDSRVLEALYASNLRSIALLDSESIVVHNEFTGALYVFSSSIGTDQLVPIDPNSVEAAIIRGKTVEAIEQILS
ncbi:MAG: hypothetical protein QXN59_02880 [Candidatus Micrarchaeaceae archaeon]